MSSHVRYQDWRTGGELDLGTHDGTQVRDDSLVMTQGCASRDYCDPHRDSGTRSFEQATWTSPLVSLSFPVTEVIASWNASTPSGTWLEVEVAGTTQDGRRTPWYVLARWAENDSDISPTSVRGQSDELARVEQDTLVVDHEHPLSTYQIRVNLLRIPGSSTSPALTLAGAMASNIPPSQPTGAPRVETGRHVLDVPAYTQMIHRGEYPQWDNGGASWCSPTSTSMVLGHWNRGPTPEEYSWVDPGYRDRFVDHAARHTFDSDFAGAGNWAFNTAYAARYGVVAYVTRLRDLAEAERFLRAGIPLVASLSFRRDQLDGAGYDTAGHLVTVVGFDESGDVVCNDPASHGIASNAEVPTTYDRVQFETAWLGSSGGVVYVICPPEVTTPAPPEEPNWR